MGKLLRRLQYWFRRRRAERELAEEIEVHRALRQQELERSGMPPNEAAIAARRAMGDVLIAREDARGVWVWPWLEAFTQDARFAVRQLRESPGFTSIAVLTLAVAIGANTAVFTIVNGVLLEQLPYKDPDRLVLMFEQLPNAPGKFPFSPPDFEFLRAETRSFSGMAAYRTLAYEVSGIAAPERQIGARVSPELAQVLGAQPAIGRFLTAEDDRQQAKVVVLGYAMWSRVLARDPAVIGRSVLLDRQPYTVIGVMPEQFQFPPRGPDFNGEPAEFFVPIAFSKEEREGYGMFYNQTVVARLKPGVSIEGARAEIRDLLKPMLSRYPAVLASFVSKISVPIVPFGEEVSGRSRGLLFVLMAAVAIVLLIACANVANLMLTRSASRLREIAIRASIGAGPGRILRQLLTEALVLAFAGGSLGLLLAYWSVEWMLALAGQTLPRAESIAMNHRVLAFTTIVTLAAPLIFAVLPAFRAAFAPDAEILKSNARNASPGCARSRLLAAFVIAQAALALVLSVGAGLLVRSFVRLLETSPGFRPEHVIAMTMTLPSGRYATGPQMRTFHQGLIDAVRRVPGLAAVGGGSDLPLSVRERRAFSAQGAIRDFPEKSRMVAPSWVYPGYFEALGIPLKSGRPFTDADDRNAQRVVIINETVARMLWPGADPIGHAIKWGIDASFAPWMTIVGVAADVKESTIDRPASPQVYVPLLQQPLDEFFRRFSIVVRSDRDVDALTADLLSAARQTDPELPVKAAPLTDIIGDSVKPQRFNMTLLTAFAAIALALAAIGIYGVLSNAVAQQTQEIGIRIAFGATRGAVVWMVFRRTLAFTTSGVIIGVIAAAIAARVMSSLLYQVRPTDVIAFAGAAAALAGIALTASLIPAWRATRVDPIAALKEQ